ncbi:hypothetical protein IL992_36765 [Microbispora sp. NEAU-D428]|nr:hypothetical protein [Microbispora sitophila]MBE3014690.1 hypothetical protein [Microbispora sitophila]
MVSAEVELRTPGPVRDLPDGVARPPGLRRITELLMMDLVSGAGKDR